MSVVAEVYGLWSNQITVFKWALLDTRMTGVEHTGEIVSKVYNFLVVLLQAKSVVGSMCIASGGREAGRQAGKQAGKEGTLHF